MCNYTGSYNLTRAPFGNYIWLVDYYFIGSQSVFHIDIVQV